MTLEHKVRSSSQHHQVWPSPREKKKKVLFRLGYEGDIIILEASQEDLHKVRHCDSFRSQVTSVAGYPAKQKRKISEMLR